MTKLSSFCAFWKLIIWSKWNFLLNERFLKWKKCKRPTIFELSIKLTVYLLLEKLDKRYFGFSISFLKFLGSEDRKRRRSSLSHHQSEAAQAFLVGVLSTWWGLGVADIFVPVAVAVTLQMFLEMILSVKSLSTLGAHLIFATRVNYHVSSQMLVAFECLATHTALIWSVFIVTLFVTI